MCVSLGCYREAAHHAESVNYRSLPAKPISKHPECLETSHHLQLGVHTRFEVLWRNRPIEKEVVAEPRRTWAVPQSSIAPRCKDTTG